MIARYLRKILLRGKFDSIIVFTLDPKSGDLLHHDDGSPECLLKLQKAITEDYINTLFDLGYTLTLNGVSVNKDNKDELHKEGEEG